MNDRTDKHKSAPAAPSTAHLTVRQLAERWQVSPDKILSFIRSGRLRAWDAATPGSRRPRWRVALADVLAYEQSRAARPGVSPRRRKANRDVINYF